MSTGELAVNAALVVEATQATAGGAVVTAAGGAADVPSETTSAVGNFTGELPDAAMNFQRIRL